MESQNRWRGSSLPAGIPPPILLLLLHCSMDSWTFCRCSHSCKRECILQLLGVLRPADTDDWAILVGPHSHSKTCETHLFAQELVSRLPGLKWNLQCYDTCCLLFAVGKGDSRIHKRVSHSFPSKGERIQTKQHRPWSWVAGAGLFPPLGPSQAPSLFPREVSSSEGEGALKRTHWGFLSMSGTTSSLYTESMVRTYAW